MAMNNSGQVGTFQDGETIKIFDYPVTCLSVKPQCKKHCECFNLIDDAQAQAVPAANQGLIKKVLDALYGENRKPKTIYTLKGYCLDYSTDLKTAGIKIAKIV